MADPEALSGSELAAFDPPIARAVVAVLRSEGLRAWLVGESAEGASLVHVEPENRAAALAALSRRMEEVHARAGEEAEMSGDLGVADPPLVMERFRRAGLAVGVVLAPLLVITLARTRLSVGMTAAIVVGGVVALMLARRSR